MSPRPDVSAQRMPQILAAAARVFGEKGLASATVANVADAAGFSKALVFKYFHSKDELVLALVASLFGDFPEPRRAPERSCAAALLDWAQGAGAAVAANATMASVGLELMAEASRDPAMHGVVLKAYGGLASALVAILDQGVAEGEFAAADMTAVARAIIAQTEGANLLHLVRLEGFAVQTAYQDGVRLILEAIRA